MCLNMSGRQDKREQQLSKDTAVALFRTCCGIVEPQMGMIFYFENQIMILKIKIVIFDLDLKSF